MPTMEIQMGGGRGRVLILLPLLLFPLLDTVVLNGNTEEEGNIDGGLESNTKNGSVGVDDIDTE